MGALVVKGLKNKASKQVVKEIPEIAAAQNSWHCVRIFPYSTEYGDLLRKSLYSVRIRDNMDQKKLRIWTLFTQTQPMTAFVSLELNTLTK